MSSYYHRKLLTYFKNHQKQLERDYPGVTSKYLLSTFDHPLFPPNAKNYYYLISALNRGYPLAYLLGEQYFHSTPLLISPDVLIPRFESEVLVEEALTLIGQMNSAQSTITVCDVGCGPGTLLLPILINSTIPIAATACDISPQAVQLTRDNYFKGQHRIDIASTLQTMVCDRLSKVEEKFHLIITNPPYIKAAEDRSTVHHKVEEFEPHLALFLPDQDYLDWFKDLFLQAFDHLIIGGAFLLEGHENHLAKQASLLESCGFSDIAILDDLNQRPRLIRCYRK